MSALSARVWAALMVSAGVACASSGPTPPTAPATAPATHASATASQSDSHAAAPLPTTLLPGVGMTSGKPSESDVEADELSGPPPPCTKDEDCWSKTCCPAKAPEECVHASRARKCAIVDVACKPSPIHYSCVCDSGACKGRLAPP